MTDSIKTLSNLGGSESFKKSLGKRDSAEVVQLIYCKFKKP